MIGIANRISLEDIFKRAGSARLALRSLSAMSIDVNIENAGFFSKYIGGGTLSFGGDFTNSGQFLLTAGSVVAGRLCSLGHSPER